MDSKRKRMLLFIGSLLVAVMFLTGAAGLGSGNSSPSSGSSSPATHTLHITNTFLASGILNATVYGYGSSIKLALRNNTYINKTAAILSSLESNGSISTFTQVSGTFELYAGKYNTYQIYVDLLKELGNNSFSFSAPEYIKLPAQATLGVRNTTIVVNTSLARDYQLYSNPIAPNSIIQTRVLALVGVLNNTYVLVPNNVTVTKV
ncbi:MAG: hypothetical protein ACP5MZ_01230 [Candidatus Micrarchaeia archaeon]